jgi:hypothetical protein
MPTRHAAPIEDCEFRPSEVELMLESLPAQHREIIIATYFRGWTTLEAARELGLTPHVARVRLYKAMRELSDMVAVDWPNQVRPDPAGSPNAGRSGSTEPRNGPWHRAATGRRRSEMAALVRRARR